MATCVKICGLNDPGAVDAAVSAGADYLGFIIFPKSPRHVSVAQAGALVKRKGKANTVAVLVDPNDALLADVLVKMRPDFIQLHGQESPARCFDARQYCERGVWKALGVSAADDLNAVDAYRGRVDGFVFDAKPPKGADRPGGLGAAWDYGLLKGFDAGAPWLLAGGLTIETVGPAVARSGAAGVDVVSATESAPGVKDPDKIRAFVAAARGRDALAS